MARANFPVEVDGIGSFIFKARTLRSQFLIEAEASRVMGGPCADEALRQGAIQLATLLVLTVEAPQGWDLEALDPLIPEDIAKVFTVHRRLREVEAGFRPGSSEAGKV
jgi:hypothetical protein